MFKPMSLRRLQKLVRSSGYEIRPTGKEWGVFDGNGKLVLPIAVCHGKGKPNEVKPVYVKAVLELIEQAKAKEDDNE